MGGYQVTDATTWRRWVTPRDLWKKPVHRWYLFAHSFTAELVQALAREWALDSEDNILDPFTGAGTTLLAAKEMRIPARGYDLSPLAVLVANAKTACVDRGRLESRWDMLERNVAKPDQLRRRGRRYCSLVERALPDGRLEALDGLARRISELDGTDAERDFFRVALLSVIPRFSLAVANGGWLRWTKRECGSQTVEEAFKERVEMMLSDVCNDVATTPSGWRTGRADARALPDGDETYSAVITSPPYPNRHDYTRVFGVELMFEFLNWEENRALRHQSFHSHPEAKPDRPNAEEYVPPAGLEASIENVQDRRIRRMLRGYFLDMYLALREVRRVCRKGAKAAFVVGNARYAGKSVLVDEFTAEVGEGAGLLCREIRAVRWRGNSAQQMGKYGRIASRESVVIFEKA